MKSKTKVSLLALAATAALVMANCSQEGGFGGDGDNFRVIGQVGGIDVWGNNDSDKNDLVSEWANFVKSNYDMSKITDEVNVIYMVTGSDEVKLEKAGVLKIGTNLTAEALGNWLHYLFLAANLDNSRDTVRMAKTSNPVDATEVAQQVLTAKQQNQIAAMHREMGLAQA
ncbi:MAG: hypothetical protein FWD91_06180 [Treponema sp.]|nr:hypothetical protein [Treponema sp.]